MGDRQSWCHTLPRN
ncbi:hypothetical protein BIW11_05359 [Tropilaelaps mercedesae]|uniref:Uncharacterized protein n=1 Tax=Tropilaelaps mercedesae TaxID=418985 RepID=A0A1V9Y2M8_9ACAR|nr:hypothetical protein BIW11_05359 [Tropilaelaps mercedesae]